MRRLIRLLIPIMIVFASLVLAGCGLSPDKTVAKFLDAFRNMDSAEMSNYILDGDKSEAISELEEDPEQAQSALMLLSKVTYQINKPTVVKNTATVPVTMTCVDMPRLLADLMPQMLSMAFAVAFSDQSDEDIDVLSKQLIENAINAPDVPMTTINTEFSLAKEHGKWLIEFDEDSATSLVNAVTGNLGSLFEE